MASGRRDRRLNGGGSVKGARMWLEVGETEDIMVGQCIRSNDVAVCRRDRG